MDFQKGTLLPDFTDDAAWAAWLHSSATTVQAALTPLRNAGSQLALVDAGRGEPTGVTWLMAAAFHRCPQALRTAVRRFGAAHVDDRDSDGWTALMYAVDYDDRVAVDAWDDPACANVLLSAAGACVNATAYDGSTPLLWAAGCGHHAIVATLVQCDDLDIDAVNSASETAEAVAAELGNAPLVLQLKAAVSPLFAAPTRLYHLS